MLVLVLEERARRPRVAQLGRPHMAAEQRGVVLHRAADDNVAREPRHLGAQLDARAVGRGDRDAEVLVRQRRVPRRLPSRGG